MLWCIFSSVIRADNFNGIIVHLSDTDIKFLYSDDPIISIIYFDQFEVLLKNGDKFKYEINSLKNIEVISDSTSSSTSIPINKKNEISVVTKDDYILIYGLKENERINIYNLNGEHIYDVALKNKENEIFLSKKRFVKGTYILHFSSGLSFKFIIN